MKKLQVMVAVIALFSVSVGVCASQSQNSAGKVLTSAELEAKKTNDILDAATTKRRIAEELLKQAKKEEDELYLKAGRYGYLQSLALYEQKIEDFLFSLPSQLNIAFWGPVQEDDNFAMRAVKNYSAHTVLAVAAVGAGYLVVQRLMAPKKAKHKVVVE